MAPDGDSPGTTTPYALLAEHYELLFPLAAGQARFLEGLMAATRARLALDVGAGAGSHLDWLSSRGVGTVGLEPDPHLFARLLARRWTGPAPTLVNRGFDALPLPWQPFDLVLCLGNTLPHAQTRDDARRAVAAMIASTRPGGTLALQTVNYDAVVRRGAWEFPPIARRLPDGRSLLLERRYDTSALPEAVELRVTLTLDGVPRTAFAPLLTLGSREIHSWLDGAGTPRCYGTYDLDPFDERSPALIVTLTRSG